jgi:hypothetical protein
VKKDNKYIKMKHLRPRQASQFSYSQAYIPSYSSCDGTYLFAFESYTGRLVVIHQIQLQSN